MGGPRLEEAWFRVRGTRPGAWLYVRMRGGYKERRAIKASLGWRQMEWQAVGEPETLKPAMKLGGRQFYFGVRERSDG